MLRLRIIGLIVAGLLIFPVLPILAYGVIAPPITPLMVIRSSQGYTIQRKWVPLRQISVPLRRAIIVSEDTQFCSEKIGIDFDALRNQLQVWTSGGRPTGASTITMQTTRNLFLWPGRSYFRKLLEMWLTPQLAMLWPKERVLEVYLNVVELGPGVFGVQAASQHFFGKDASELNTLEASLLAEVLPDPMHRSPQTLEPREKKRANLTAIPVLYGSEQFACVEK